MFDKFVSPTWLYLKIFNHSIYLKSIQTLNFVVEKCVIEIFMSIIGSIKFVGSIIL